MEFAVSKADLVRELNLSQGVVEKKTTIPILSNVLIETGEDHVVLTATDLELGIRCSCPAEIRKPGAGTIPVRRLLDYVRLLPEAPINIKIADNHWAQLLCGRSRTRIAGMSRESYPDLPEMPDPLIEIPVATLTSLISRTIFAIAAEESRFTLNGALMQAREGRLTLVATDGHRLALCEQAFECGELIHKALLPKKAMQELLKLALEIDPETKIQFASGDNHLFFRAGDRLLLCRKLTGNFPDYERVLPDGHEHSIVLAKDELRSTIERVAQFSDERSHAIRLQVTPGEAKMHSSLSDTGETEETLPVSYDGPDLEVGFNAQYLVDFLRAVPEPDVAFHFRDAGSAGELRPEGESLDYTYRYVVMPMRI